MGKENEQIKHPKPSVEPIEKPKKPGQIILGD